MAMETKSRLSSRTHRSRAGSAIDATDVDRGLAEQRIAEAPVGELISKITLQCEQQSRRPVAIRGQCGQCRQAHGVVIREPGFERLSKIPDRTAGLAFEIQQLEKPVTISGTVLRCTAFSRSPPICARL